MPWERTRAELLELCAWVMGGELDWGPKPGAGAEALGGK
jgi:hypothetical protein